MTPPKHEDRSAWRQVAGARAAVLMTAACSPAGTSAPVPAPEQIPPPAAAMPTGSSAETIVAAAPASPAGPIVPVPAAATPVVVRPSAPSPAVPAPVPVPALSAPPATVTPVRVGLPAGPGRETVQQVCTGCHAIGMVTANGRTSDGWAEIIERMMGLGLEASDEDLQTVHAYLTREFPPRRAN